MLSKNKIFFYINNLEKGGAERVIIQLASQFCDNGSEVVIVTSYFGNDEYTVSSNIRRIVLEEEHYVENRIKRNLKLIKKLRSILKKEEPDILIAFMQEPNFRAILATKGLKTKCLISVRNDPNREYAGKIGKFIGKRILPLADGCVFQTKEAQKWFPYKLQKKSKVILNEVSECFFNVEHSPNNNIVAVGRLCEQKNHRMLIEAFSKIEKDFSEKKLLIYGTGSLKKELELLIEEKKLENKIFLMGTTNDVSQILKTAELFILSSDYEGMPNALLEALAVGVPCIATDCPCGGPKMLIEQEVNGILIPIKDTNQLTIEMRRVLSDKKLRERLGTNAKQKAKEYKPDVVFKQWEQFVKDIVKSR